MNTLEKIFSMKSQGWGKAISYPSVFYFGAGGIGGFMNDISIDISKAAIGSGYFYGLGFDIFKNISLELSQSKLSIDQSELDKDNIVSPIEQTSTNLMN